MTSFSDFPIFFAMSLTLNFAAAIESPWFGCQVAKASAGNLATRQAENGLLDLRLFLRCFGVFGRGLSLGIFFLRLAVLRLTVVRGLVLLLFFVALGRRFIDLLVLAGDLDHLLGH